VIYLEIRERLGNQFFQYAFARNLMIKFKDNLSINFEAVYSRCDEEYEWNNEKYGWRNTLVDFNVCEHTITTQKNYSTIQKLLLHLIMQYTKDDNYLNIKRKQSRLFRILNKFGIYCLLDGYMDISRPFLFIKDKIVIGYFESFRYFNDIDDVIKKEFTPKYPILDYNVELYNLINSTESVCVSIRRGDFLLPKYKDEIYICDEQYFYRGIELIKSLVPKAVLFIFSDDINWVKENMHFEGEVYYECGDDPVWEKIRLMRACKHFVISNSSFSWWVQHLSTNKNKVVVAPRRWRKDGRTVDLYEDNWTLIDD